MLTNKVMADAFERIGQVVHRAVDGLSEKDLMFRPNDTGNSIAWLVWHLARVQDDHISDAAGTEQVWHDGWADKFDLPFNKDATGWGQSSKEVSAVKASDKLLLGYYDAVQAATLAFIRNLKESRLREDHRRELGSAGDAGSAAGERHR